VRAAKAIKLPRPKTALDEARNFHGWTGNKLELLALYFKVYRRVAGNGSYIDGFAGSGRVRVEGVVRPGSASIALTSATFKHLYLFETPKVAATLRRNLAADYPTKQQRWTATGGDFNEEIKPLLEDHTIPIEKPCFAFLDPDSTQLDWDTIKVLADYKRDQEHKVELWVLFATHHALFRLMPRRRSPKFAESPSAATLDRVMGGREAWWDLYEPDRRPGQLVIRYRERIKALGYREVAVRRIIDPLTHKPQYFMVHASDHQAAFNLMHWAAGQLHMPEDAEQLELLGGGED